jgi:hypothetical protein
MSLLCILPLQPYSPLHAGITRSGTLSAVLQLGNDGQPVDVQRLKILIHQQQEKQGSRQEAARGRRSMPRRQASEEGCTSELPLLDLELPAFAAHQKEFPGGHGASLGLRKHDIWTVCIKYMIIPGCLCR